MQWAGRDSLHELRELYQTARIALSGTNPNRHARMVWAVDQFRRRHPDCEDTRKALWLAMETALA